MLNKDIFEKLIKQNLINLLKGINVFIFLWANKYRENIYNKSSSKIKRWSYIPINKRNF